MKTFLGVSRMGPPDIAAAPSISAPASRKRIVSRRSGGQSARAILEIEKADAQSAQNAPIRTEMGIEGAGRGRVAARMGLIPGYAPKLGRLCSIWKLND
jgi:hypothetical protein